MSNAIMQSRPSDLEVDKSPILRGDDDTVSMARAALSSDDTLAGHETTGDIVEHEQTFEGFLSVLTVAAQHVISCLIALAIGGIEGFWVLASMFFILATAAALAGVFSKSIRWKLGGLVLGLEVLTWLVLA